MKEQQNMTTVRRRRTRTYSAKEKSALDPTWQQSAQSSVLPPRVERLLQQTLEPASATPAEAQ